MPHRYRPTPLSITAALGAETRGRGGPRLRAERIANAEDLRRIAHERPPVTATLGNAVIASLHVERGNYVMMGTTGRCEISVESIGTESLGRAWVEFVGLQIRVLRDETPN